MKKNFPLIMVASLLLIACQGKQTSSENRNDTTQITTTMDTTVSPSADEKVYFKGSGTEPFWSIEISEKVIRFISLRDAIDTLNFPHTEPERAMDANVKRYRASTAGGELIVQIMQSACTNAMSGKESAYTVKVEIKRGADSALSTLEGCGQYIADYRLHDIWVLEELHGEKVSASQFQQELPNMEINSNELSFMGFAGCNRMNGKLFSERDLLRFTQVVTTRMACAGDNQEAAFLTALQSATQYKIANNRLYLSNPNGQQLVFKKVD